MKGRTEPPTDGRLFAGANETFGSLTEVRSFKLEWIWIWGYSIKTGTGGLYRNGFIL